MNEPIVSVCVDFVRSIGIDVRFESGVSGFLPHIMIENGGLAVDPCCPVSDILHEAAHIAIMPRRYRHMLNGDIRHALVAAWKDAESIDPHPEAPLLRALLQCSDPEATAWAWAAGKHLGFRDWDIIPDTDDPRIYSGQAWVVRQAHEWGDPLGAHGLAAAGFCQVGMRNRYNPRPKYPRLAFWTQEL